MICAGSFRLYIVIIIWYRKLLVRWWRIRYSFDRRIIFCIVLKHRFFFKTHLIQGIKSRLLTLLIKSVYGLSLLVLTEGCIMYIISSVIFVYYYIIVSALYFEAIDHIGHRFGPNSTELRECLIDLDRVVGDIMANITSEGLKDLVSVIFVSDHGMTDISITRSIDLTG